MIFLADKIIIFIFRKNKPDQESQKGRQTCLPFWIFYFQAFPYGYTYGAGITVTFTVAAVIPPFPSLIS